MVFKPIATSPHIRTYVSPTKEALEDAASNLSLELGVSAGLVENWKLATLQGRVTSVANGDESQVWRGATLFPSYPTIAGAIRLVSDSASDAAAGAGAKEVVVHYINEDGWPRVGIATCTGITPAIVFQGYIDDAGVVQYLAGFPAAVGFRVNKAYVRSLGSTAPGTLEDANIGNIDITIASNPVARIGLSALSIAGSEGDNCSFGSSFHIPRGRFGLLANVALTTNQLSGVVTTTYLKSWLAPRLRYQQREETAGSVINQTEVPLRLSPRTDIYTTLYRAAGTGTLSGSCMLQCVLMQDPSDLDPSPERQPYY